MRSWSRIRRESCGDDARRRMEVSGMAKKKGPDKPKPPKKPY